MARRILIATPAFGGQITVGTAQSVELARQEGQRNGWEVRWLPLVGSADIADMRNQILGLFLQADCADLLMVDADISWGPGNFERIMGHDVAVVAGLYRERTDVRHHYPVRWPATRYMHGNLLEAEAVPAGFLRMRRDCIERMSAADGVHWVRDDHKLRGTRYPFLFDWTWVGNERLSEDYAFCRAWRAIGGTVYVDPALKLHHTGTKTFKGDFMDQVQAETLAAVRDPVQAALMLAGEAA